MYARLRSGAWIAAGLLVALTAHAQRIPSAGGFNLFSKDQDIQLGKEASAEIEKEVRLVTNRELVAYVERIGQRLAATGESGEYPYTFKVVQDEAINAFALPGGPTYVNTGLILAAEDEAQLAGVMGHEIAHVALRHGTRNASRSQLINLGAILGGGLIGGDSMLGQLAKMGIGLGASSVLLKYSRGAESDADLLGAHIMARAGYNPIEAALFFEKLEAETGNRSGLETFFSSHPNPGNRSERIQEQLPYMPVGPYNSDSGQLSRMQSIIKGLPQAPKPAPAASPANVPEASAPPPPSRPSNRFRLFQGSGFAVSYPEDWQVYAESGSASATFAPQGGIVQSGRQAAIGRGVIARIEPLRRRADLVRDTQALIDQFRQSNPSMQPSGRKARNLQVAGQPALLTTLYSNSAYGRSREIDLLLTVARPDGLFYMLFIAPEAEYRLHQAAFEQMMRSVQLGR